MVRKYKGGYATCRHCEKTLYMTRKEAKRQARKRHPEKVLNAYYCPLGRGFHYGNIPIGGRDRARLIMESRVNIHYGKARITTRSDGAGMASGEESRADDSQQKIGEAYSMVFSYSLEGKEDAKVN